jgi:signal transduction histidine kinase
MAAPASRHERHQAHACGDRQGVSGMLGEILFVLLVLTVGALMVMDVIRTRSESPHGQADRTAYGAGRTAVARSRGPEAVAFSPQLAGGVTTAQAPDSGRSRRPESISPPPASEPRASTEPAYRKGSSGRLAGSDVQSRILLLAIIPAVTAAVVTLCIVRIVALLSGTSINSQISSVHDEAVISVVLAGVVLVVVLPLGLWATIKAARFVLRPWQGLQAGVLQEAGSSEETGEPANVFDQMRRELSRLTANEAQLRARLNTMFVNLSHRSRSLVERQIRLLGNLEHGEQDERRLANLASVSRIAIHLYRNSENLLILAGQEPSTDSNQPLTLTYVVQAATSEIEEGERVSFDVRPDIAVRGPAVGDVVHLLAELIQNATSFSAADMPVHVTGHVQPTGGVLVDITDCGIGMTAKEMAYANWQLENPPATDLDTAKWMGLLVVARLAARHRIRVRLNQSGSGGLTALVWLPDEVATYQGAAGLPMSSGLGRSESASGLPEAAGPGYSAAEADQRSGPAWSPGGLRPMPRAEPPVTARTEPLVTTQAEAAVTAWAEPAATDPAESPVTAQAEPAVTDQAEQLLTPQAEPPATGRSSGSGPPDATAEDVGESGLAARAVGEEAAPVEVIVPPAEDLATIGGPPIYDEVESFWFSSGRQAPVSSRRTAAVENRWSSPGDEGWQAAQAVDSPSSGGATAAGLPRRLPNANLVPGSISTKPPAVPSRSAAAARDRLAGFQRGVSEGRAAASEMVDAGGKDES